jgi:signal transduction histidine kinase
MRWRIRSQLLVPSLLLLIGVAGVSVWSGIDTARRARSRLEKRVQEVAQNLVEETNYALSDNVLAQMKRLSGADFLVVPRDGAPVSTLNATPDDLPTAGDNWRTLRLERTVRAGGKVYLCSGIHLSRPPRSGETLYILYPEALWRDELREALEPILIVGGACGLASLGLAIVLGQRLARRVREVERRTRLIAGGDFGPMPLPAPNDELRDLASSVNDMAGRLAQLHETIRRTERLRLLGQVGAGLAHQMRNGLTGARLAVQVYLQEHANNGDQAALDVALRQLTLLESNLKRFLDLGRGEGLKFVPCSLTALVTEAVELVRPRCKHTGIELRWEPPGDPLMLTGDASQLGQMILNVVGNAIEAAGPGGTVEVLAATGDTAATVLEVADTGPGPPPAVAERLFEPFVTGKPEGVGLGLAVTRQIAEAHGGRISWRRVERRTVFRIELPQVAVKALATS